MKKININTIEVLFALVIFGMIGIATLSPHETTASQKLVAELDQQQQENFYQEVSGGQSGRIHCPGCNIELSFDRQTGDVLYEAISIPATMTLTMEPSPTATMTPLPPTETATAEPTETPLATPTSIPTPMIGGVFPTFANRPTKIYPLGDSITRGETQNSAYRYHLVNWMATVDVDFDMVGPVTAPNKAVRFAGTVDSGWDFHHGSYTGWQPDFYLQTMTAQNWAFVYNPDVVLIHLGTNGHLPNHINDLSSSTGDYLGIINEFRAVNPNVVLYIVQIHGKADTPANWLEDFNNGIFALASTHSTAQSPIIVVDGWTGFDAGNTLTQPSTHTVDGIHLNDAGAELLAYRFISAMFPPVPVATPTIEAPGGYPIATQGAYP